MVKDGAKGILSAVRDGAKGVLLATRYPRFWVGFVLTFVIFGTLMSLLSGGTAAFSLFFATDFSGKLQILADGFLGIFGVGRSLLDFALIFSITVLQSILIGLIVLVYHIRPKNPSCPVNQGSASVQNASLVAGLAVLGSGCPTCGTALITPVLGAIFSTGGYAIASAVSGVITIIAIIIVLFSISRVGRDAYTLICAERAQKHRGGQPNKPAKPAKSELPSVKQAQPAKSEQPHQRQSSRKEQNG